MTAFQSGFRMGGDIYQRGVDTQFRQEELAMKKAAEARAAEMHGLQADGLRRTASLENQKLDTVANITALDQGWDRGNTIKAWDDTFEQANQAALRGLQMPAVQGGSNMAEQQALRVNVDPNSSAGQGRAAGLMRQLALLNNDIGTARAIGAEERTRLGTEDTRAFLTKGQQLFVNRTQSPEAMQAWQEFARPYTNMISQYSGLAFDARVNPKTGVIERIPYEGGSIEAVDFNQAAPYLMGAYKLTSQYGSPEEAVKALNQMSEAERARVLSDSATRFGIGEKVGTSIARARGQDIQAGELQVSRERLKTEKERLLRPEWELFVDADNNVVPVDMNSLKRGPEGTGVLPKGLRKLTKPLTPAERAKAISELVDAGYSKEQASILVDQTGRGGAAVDDSALVQKNGPTTGADQPATAPTRANANRGAGFGARTAPVSPYEQGILEDQAVLRELQRTMPSGLYRTQR